VTGVLSERQLTEVTGIVERVAQQLIVPRFGRLRAEDLREKSPGELVTIADQDAERELGRALTGLLPGSVVVGEEAASVEPGLLRALAEPAPVWILDPIDGTEAFATGSPRFATLVTLACAGRSLACWTYAPLLGLTATAVAGGGAYLNGQPIRVAEPAGTGLRDLDVLMSQPRWWTDEHRPRFNALFAAGVTPSFFDTAGLAYLELARGRRSAMVISWELVWDHAAGLLLHAEAGGQVLTATGDRFELAGGNALPAVAVTEQTTGRALLAALTQGL
jgi:fructose-1,6-bisphosphatase/inositol monophosphatase family enzyme